MSVFDLGMVSVTFRKKSPREIVDLVASTNLQGIEWGGDVHVPPGDVALARDVRTMTADAGLQIPSYGSYFRVGEQDVSEFEDVIATARALGTTNIRVWAGRKGSAEADEAYTERVVRDSHTIAEMAKAVDIAVSYEYHNNTLADTREATLNLLKAVDHDNLFTYWQINTSNPELVHNRDTLTGILPRLSHVHVFHIQDRKRRPLAEGVELWEEYLRILREDGGRRWLLLEFVSGESEDVFRDDAATLRRWAESSGV